VSKFLISLDQSQGMHNHSQAFWICIDNHLDLFYTICHWRPLITFSSYTSWCQIGKHDYRLNGVRISSHLWIYHLPKLLTVVQYVSHLHINVKHIKVLLLLNILKLENSGSVLLSLTIFHFSLDLHICVCVCVILAFNDFSRKWKIKNHNWKFQGYIVYLLLWNPYGYLVGLYTHMHFTCSTRFWSLGPWFRSTARRPVKSSRRTTPKA
jgi:hypothetical protein